MAEVIDDGPSSFRTVSEEHNTPPFHEVFNLDVALSWEEWGADTNSNWELGTLLLPNFSKEGTKQMALSSESSCVNTDRPMLILTTAAEISCCIRGFFFVRKDRRHGPFDLWSLFP